MGYQGQNQEHPLYLKSDDTDPDADMDYMDMTL